MEALSWLALIFLTLYGYSAGAVWGARIKRGGQAPERSPSLVDTLSVVVLWIGAIVSRLAILGRWAAVGIWFAAALGSAFVMSLARVQTEEGKPITQ